MISPPHPVNLKKTQALLVFGRRIPAHSVTRDWLRDLRTAANAVNLEAVPAGDVANLEEKKGRLAHEVVIGCCLLQAPAASGGPVGPVDLEAIRAAVASAQKELAVGWARLTTRVAFSVQPSAPSLWMIATGPLCSGWLAYGIRGTEEDADRWGVRFAIGASRHGSHTIGVAGYVVRVSFEATATLRMNLSDDAHASRADIADGLWSDSGYWLIGQYD